MNEEILKAVRAWAGKNAAGWVLELLHDERPQKRGPFRGCRACDLAAEKFAKELGLMN